MNIAFNMCPGTYLIVPPEYAPALTEILVNSIIASREYIGQGVLYIESTDIREFPEVTLVRNQDIQYKDSKEEE